MTPRIDTLFRDSPELLARLERYAQERQLALDKALYTILDVTLPKPDAPADTPFWINLFTFCDIQGGADGEPARSCGSCYSDAKAHLSSQAFQQALEASPALAAAHAFFQAP